MQGPPLLPLLQRGGGGGGGIGMFHRSAVLLQRVSIHRHRNTKVFMDLVIMLPPLPSFANSSRREKGLRGGGGISESGAGPSSLSRGISTRGSGGLNTWDTISPPFRLEMELFSSETPVAAKHFEDFCTGKYNVGEGDRQEEEEDENTPLREDCCIPVGREGEGAEGVFASSSSRLRPRLSYQYSTFHRLHKGFILQGGDVYSSEGVHQMSLFGEDTYDAPEETKKSFFSQPSFHHRGLSGESGRYSPKGLLGTAVSAPHLNGSQFFIVTTNKKEDVAHLDQTCICFGKVLEKCFPILDEIEQRVVVEAGGELMEGYRIEIVHCGLA